jgi:predicted dehydrogenase
MSEKLRTVFIGYGRRANHYAMGIADMPEFQIVAAADPDGEIYRMRREQVAPDSKFYSDWRAMLDAEDFELAVIASPDCFHEEQALAVLERGKHLLLEKPMALTAEGCMRIIEAQRKTGAKIIIGFVLRYHSLYQDTRRLVADGAIGAVKAVWVQHSVMLNYFHNWMSQRAMSGGLMLQKATHDIDLISWIAGGTPLRVSAFAGLDEFGGDEPNDLVCPECPRKDDCLDVRPSPQGGHPLKPHQRGQLLCAFRKEIDVFDNHVVNILYEEGFKASYSECHFTPISRRHFLFIGDEGQVATDSLDNSITLIRRGERKREIYTPRVVRSGHGGGDQGLLGDLRRALLEDGQPVADSEAGFMSVMAAEAAERSAADGRIVDLADTLKKYRSMA